VITVEQNLLDNIKHYLYSKDNFYMVRLGAAVCWALMRFGTMGTRLAGLGEKDRGAYHESAHSA
jgi:hypothetical protein